MREERITTIAEMGYIVLILTVAAVFGYLSSRLPPAPYDPMGPKFFPLSVSVVLGALGVAMLVKVLFGRGLSRGAQSLVVGLETAGEHIQRPLTAVLTIVLAVLYAIAFVVPGIGFLPATAVYLFLSGVVLGPLEPKRLLGVAAFAIIMAFALDRLFRVLLQLDLA